MKCNKVVAYHSRTKKSGEIVWKPVAWGDTLSEVEETVRLYPMKNGTYSYRTCHGKIVAQVSLEALPYFGGTDHTIEIFYACDECGFTYFNIFDEKEGTEDLLSRLVTEYVASLPDTGMETK